MLSSNRETLMAFIGCSIAMGTYYVSNGAGFSHAMSGLITIGVSTISVLAVIAFNHMLHFYRQRKSDEN
jgi:hypothetical protein